MAQVKLYEVCVYDGFEGGTSEMVWATTPEEACKIADIHSMSNFSSDLFSVDEVDLGFPNQGCKAITTRVYEGRVSS